MKTLLLILLTSLSFKSCQNDNKNINNVLYFDLKDLSKFKSLKLSDLQIIDIYYIPLESKDNCILEDIKNIRINKNQILIKFFNRILLFRTDGSFVSKIGNEGRGPNEFQVAHDVEIDERNQNIYLIDGWEKKVLVFSETGEFLSSFKIPFYGPIEYRYTEGRFLCYQENHMGNVGYSYNLINTDGEIIKRYPNKYPFKKSKEGALGYEHENLFYYFNNQLFKKEVYSDTIYLFESMRFKPHIILDIGNRLVSPKSRSENSSIFLRDNYFTPWNLFEFGDYIYYEFIISKNNQGKHIGFIGSKKNGFKTFFDPEEGIINDLDGGPNVWPKSIKDDNTIITWIDVLQLKTHVASKAFRSSNPKYPEKKKELEKLANSLKVTDNPVLMMVRLKK